MKNEQRFASFSHACFFCPLFLFLFLPLFGQKGEREELLREIFYTEQREIVIINVYLSSLSVLSHSSRRIYILIINALLLLRK